MQPKRLLVTAVATVAIAACTVESDISEAIGVLARNAPDAVVRLDQAAPFAWDHVVFFTPYAPRDAVCTTLALGPGECMRMVTYESIDDGDMTLAFVHRGALVRYVRHPRRNGDFLPLAHGTTIARADARFRTGASGRKLVLERPVSR